PTGAKGIALTPLNRTLDDGGIHYQHVDVALDRGARVATITVRASEKRETNTVDDVLARGAAWWPLQMAREIDDAILHLRTNELEIGLWIFKTAGDRDAVIAIDDFILEHQDNWFVREVLGMMRRTFSRFDVSSRSMFAIIEPGSCF